METNESTLLARFRGTILGSAAADALAFPYQHYSRAFLRSLAVPLTQEYAVHHSGFYPRGQYTCETQQMLAVLESIVETGGVSGEAMASHLIPLWRDNVLVERDRSISLAMERLLTGGLDWERSGLEPGHAEADPVSRVPAVALWDHQDMDAMYEHVAVSTRITHRDPRVLACAAATAAAIASNAQTEELILGAFLDRVSGAASRYDPVVAEACLDFPRILSLSEYRALRHFESICPDDRYAATEDGLDEYCIPVILTALYYFLRSPYRYEKVIDSCLRVGGRITTSAFLAGAICGALVGETGIPQHLSEGILNVSELATAANDLHGAWLKRSSS
jgi:ADP-ribosylglycohydrolase